MIPGVITADIVYKSFSLEAESYIAAFDHSPGIGPHPSAITGVGKETGGGSGVRVNFPLIKIL